MHFVITVPFVAGKARPRYARGRMYTPSSTTNAEHAIAREWRRVAGNAHAPKGRPVRVDITTERPLPKSRPKRVTWEHDTFKPDCDNVAKLVLDGLNGVAWHDDAQVVSLHVRKSIRKRDVGERTTVRVEWEA